MEEIREKIAFSFEELEEIVYESVQATYLEAMKAVLKALDEALASSRDQTRYELHELRTREMSTRAGLLRFERRYYWDREESEWVALLDRALGLEKRKRASRGVRARAVEAAVAGRSYRGAQEELEREAKETAFSHEAIRQWTLQVGAVLEKQNEHKFVPEKRRVPVLFLEVDGFWPAMQRGRKRELRVLTVHEGWERRSPGSKEFRLVNRKDFMDDEGGDFWEKASEWLEQQYDLTDTWVVINGDRAPWIRGGLEWFPRSLYQLDRFHLQRELKQLLQGRPKLLEEAQQAVQASQPENLLRILAMAVKAVQDPKQRRKIRALYRDLASIPEAVRDYRLRLQEHGVATDGYQGLGAAEGAVARYSGRLRGVGRSWSRRGLRAMARALAAWFQGTLRNAVRHLELLSGLEELRLVGPRATTRALKAVADRLNWARSAHVPMLDSGRTESGGLSQLFHSIVNGTTVL